MIPAAAAADAGPPLPELRQDLQLAGEVRDARGLRVWRLYDPIAHRFHALSDKHLVMLQVWSEARAADAVVAAVWARHSELLTAEEVAEFARFLVQHGLAHSPDAGAWRPAFEQAEMNRRRLLWRLLHNYLFLRIPIADPQRFLVSTLWLVRPLGSRAFAGLMLGLTILAMLLVLRELDQFRASLSQLSSVSGAFGILIAIPIVKLLHELGHGYVAAHHGARVNSIGVALILGAPLFYVDVTDSWRLKSQRARLAVDGAGIAVDIGIAVIATLAWVLLPNGPARTIAFGLATVGWTASLMINLNPFMKFDGYHLLADSLELPNLHSRSLEFAQWRLRELLFGLGLTAPEDVTVTLRRGFVLFGLGIMIFRLILFTGIALAVYAFFFKLLGLVLFAVEIAYFILLPLWREVRDWHTMKRLILSSSRTWCTAAIVVALLGLIIAPWSTTITVPAVLEPKGFARLHVPIPARIDTTNAGMGKVVSADDIVVELSSPALQQELVLTGLRIELTDVRLARLLSDPGDRENAVVLQQERKALERKRDWVIHQAEALKVKASRAGSLVAFVDHAAPGRWVTPSEALCVLHGTDGMRVRGLAAGADVGRIRAGMPATFIPNSLLLPAVSVTIAEVASANAAIVTQVELAEPHGGSVSTKLSSSGKPVPIEAQYPVTAAVGSVEQSYPSAQPQVGVLLVRGDARSLVARLWQRVLMVLIRESGF